MATNALVLPFAASLYRRLWLLGILAGFLAFSRPCAAALLALSTNSQATLNFVAPGSGSLTFQKGDIVQVTVNASGLATGATILYSFGNVLNIDALYIRPNGNIILSTKFTETVGGVTFRAGDLIEFNPSSNTAILFLKGNTETVGTDSFGNATSVFRNDKSTRANADIDGVHLINNDPAQILLSIGSGPKRMGSNYSANSYNDEDIINYNALTDQSFMYVDFTPLFGNDVDGVSLHDNGNLLLTTNSSVTLPGISGNVTFNKGDVFEYNHSSGTVDGLPAGTARLFFSRNNFAQQEDIEAIHFVAGSTSVIPEPATATAMLLITGLIGLGWFTRNRNRCRRLELQ